MPVKTILDGEEVWFDVSERADCEFVLVGNDGSEIKVETPLNLDSEFKDKDFEVHFLTKRNVRESDIYMVHSKENGGRVGWLIPAISLSSDFHDFAENEHFLKYAYIAIRDSLSTLGNDLFSNCLDPDRGETSFSEIYHEETVFLIISKSTFKPGYVFELDRASPSLIKHGYVALSRRNPAQVRHEVSEAQNVDKIYIDEVSRDLPSNSLISTILNSLFSYEESPAFKFFYLYQIFELLIDSVYLNEQDILIESLVRAKGDSAKTKDALDDMREFMSEKNRIKLLVNRYSSVGGRLDELSKACNSLLVELGKGESPKFEVYFYKLRNFIFHQYRDFPADCHHMLNDVLVEAISVLPCMLSSFKFPEG